MDRSHLALPVKALKADTLAQVSRCRLVEDSCRIDDDAIDSLSDGRSDPFLQEIACYLLRSTA